MGNGWSLRGEHTGAWQTQTTHHRSEHSDYSPLTPRGSHSTRPTPPPAVLRCLRTEKAFGPQSAVNPARDGHGSAAARARGAESCGGRRARLGAERSGGEHRAKQRRRKAGLSARNGTERNGSAPRGRAGGKGGYETRGGARRREGRREGRREAAAPPSAKSRRRSQLGHPTGPGSAADRSRARPKGRLCRARARRSAPPRTALRYLRAVPGTTRGDAALPRSRSGPRPPRRPRLPQGRPTRSPPGRGRSARHAQTRLAPPRPPRSAQAHTHAHAHTAPLRRKRSPPRRRLTCTDRREGEPKHRERLGGKRDCGNRRGTGTERGDVGALQREWTYRAALRARGRRHCWAAGGTRRGQRASPVVTPRRQEEPGGDPAVNTTLHSHGCRSPSVYSRGSAAPRPAPHPAQTMAASSSGSLPHSRPGASRPTSTAAQEPCSSSSAATLPAAGDCCRPCPLNPPSTKTFGSCGCGPSTPFWSKAL